MLIGSRGYVGEIIIDSDKKELRMGYLNSMIFKGIGFLFVYLFVCFNNRVKKLWFVLGFEGGLNKYYFFFLIELILIEIKRLWYMKIKILYWVLNSS